MSARAAHIIDRVTRFRRERGEVTPESLEAERRRLAQAAEEIEALKRTLRERLDAVAAHASAPPLATHELEELKRTLRARADAMAVRERGLDEERRRLEREAQKLEKAAERQERRKPVDADPVAAGQLAARERALEAEHARLETRARELGEHELQLDERARDLEQR